MNKGMSFTGFPDSSTDGKEDDHSGENKDAGCESVAKFGEDNVVELKKRAIIEDKLRFTLTPPWYPHSDSEELSISMTTRVGCHVPFLGPGL